MFPENTEPAKRETDNTAEACGVLKDRPVPDHTSHGQAFYNVRLAVYRKSGTYDLIQLMIPKRLLPETGMKELKGKPVQVKGQFRSYDFTKDGHTVSIRKLFVSELAFLQKSGNNDFNRIALTGRITGTPVMRTTPKGRTITDFVISVNRGHGAIDTIPCIAWGRNAQYAAGLAEGTQIRIEGRIQSRSFVRTKDGVQQRRTTNEVSVNSIQAIPDMEYTADMGGMDFA